MQMKTQVRIRVIEEIDNTLSFACHQSRQWYSMQQDCEQNNVHMMSFEGSYSSNNYSTLICNPSKEVE